MMIRKIEDSPQISGKYFVYHVFLHDCEVDMGNQTKFIERGSLILNTIDITDEDIQNWIEKSKELKKQWDYWGMPDFPEIDENLSCSTCQYSIWSSHFKYCQQLNRELNNWFRIDAKLKDCPFR